MTAFEIIAYGAIMLFGVTLMCILVDWVSRWLDRDK